MKGARRGIASSLGNQKTYKKDTTNYYNRLTDLKNYKYKLSDGTYSDEVEDYIEADSMERIRNTKSRYGSYNKDDYQEMTVLINNKGKDKENQLAGYTLKKYTIGPKDKLANLEIGKYYKAGTKITTGKNPMTLNRLSRIAGAKGNTVYVQQIDFLDNGYKIATDIGGKGVVNGTFSTDADVSILLNKPDPSKLSIGSNKAMDTTETAITLRDSNGKKITAYGFYTVMLKDILMHIMLWDI